MTGSFDEVHVFEGIGERTGARTDRKGVHGRRTVCRSVGELTAKSRRLGDGYYYLATDAWPSGTDSVNLALTWTAMGGPGPEPQGK